MSQTISQTLFDEVSSEPIDLETAIKMFGDDQAAFNQWLDTQDGERNADYDYELRHPGHADQSVHNPHKGGAAAGAGAFVPGKWVADPELTPESHYQKVRDQFMSGKDLSPEQVQKMEPIVKQLADATYEGNANETVYRNGPVTLYVNKNAKAPLTPEMQATMDGVIAETQARYPGPMQYSWTNIPTGSTADAPIGGRIVNFDSASMTMIKNRTDNRGFKHVVWHETGHALPMRGAPESTTGMGFMTFEQADPFIMDLVASTGAKIPGLGVQGSQEPWRRVAQQVSNYATKNAVEMHAEIFALFHNPQPANNGSFSMSVINAYGEAAGWKP